MFCITTGFIVSPLPPNKFLIPFSLPFSDILLLKTNNSFDFKSEYFFNSSLKQLKFLFFSQSFSCFIKQQ